MPFVKLDCGILNSTLWFDRQARDVFITALLMAEPYELLEPTPQIQVDSLEYTGWIVPAGWYGFVPAAGVGITHRAGLDEAEGREALRVLGSPETSSRTPDYDGRRLVRIDGGYLVLNFIKYREKDSTLKERQKRWRERQKIRNANALQGQRNALHVTIAEAEAEAEASTTRASVPSDLVDAWNAITTPPIPRCAKLSHLRDTHVRARLQERPLEEWRDIIARIEASAFCRGTNDRGWLATFDWLVKNDETAVRVLEGKYDTRAPVAPARSVASAAPVYGESWCDHDPRCASPDVHRLVLARG